MTSPAPTPSIYSTCNVILFIFKNIEIYLYLAGQGVHSPFVSNAKFKTAEPIELKFRVAI